MSTEYKRQLALLLFVAVVVLTAGLGMRDPWPADEPRFALIAKDMAEGGNWLIPQIGGVLYPDKPPFFFWLVAALYSVFGSIKIAFLMPGMLAGIGVLLAVTDLARRLWSPRTAIWCGITLLAMVQFPLQMKSGQIDGLLCLWTTLSLYGFCRHLLLGPDWRWYALGGLAAGLGVITKGVGFLPYLVLIPYLFAAKSDWAVTRVSWRDARWLLAPLATLVAIGLWLVPMLLATSGTTDTDLLAYRDNILFHQTGARYLNSWGHVKPPWYLFSNAVPWLWLPVSFLLPWLLQAWRRDLRQKHAPVLLLGAWILLVLLFFSLSPGKRSLYIFPAAPALALIAGYHAADLVRRAGVRRLLLTLSTVIGVTVVGAAVYVLANPHTIGKWLPDISAVAVSGGWLLLIGVLLLITTVVSRQRFAPQGFAASMLILWLGIATLISPVLNDTRSGRSLMQEVGRRVPASETLALVDWPAQFVLQWNRPLVHFGYRREDQGEVRDAVAWLTQSPGNRLLLPGHLAAPCLELKKLQSVGLAHRRNWYLADRSALTGACTGRSPENMVYYRPLNRPLNRPQGRKGLVRAVGSAGTTQVIAR